MKNKNCVLFFCNTYMQLIAAIQIKIKLLQEADTDIILSDHSQNAEKIAKALEETKLFRRVKMVKTKFYTYDQNIFDDIKDVIAMIVGNNKKYRSLIWDEDIVYNQIFYYNLSILAYLVYDISIKNGTEPQCIRYEEGIASYPAMKESDSGKRIKLLRVIRRLFLKKDVFRNTRDFYCFYPQLFHGNEEERCYQIPFLEKDDWEIIGVLNSIFGYYAIEYKQKYIYFSTSIDIDGKNIKEDQIIKKIVEAVGRDNIVVKVHPRDTRRVYQDMGLTIWRNSEIPWEIIQLNNDFKDKVFISLSSGSILNASAILKENIRTFYIFPCVKGKDHAYDDYCEKLAKSVKDLQGLGYCKNHVITSQIEQVKTIGETLKNEEDSSNRKTIH